MPGKAYCTISATLFGLVAGLHLLRAYKDWPFQLGPLDVPTWISWAGGAVAALLSYWGFRAARRF